MYLYLHVYEINIGLVYTCIFTYVFVSGNGIGMKIVGGKLIEGSDGEVGAYVATIYPGGVADQLHGELQEGMYPLLSNYNKR